MLKVPHMLIGYVSDENYVALLDVVLEFEQDDEPVAVITSSPRGAVYGDLPPGEYRVTLAKPGYGSKTVSVTITPDDRPVHFRLLSDTLYGYMWPKWIQSGRSGEFRVHSVEPYYLTLWRYGREKELVQPIGWFDEHGPRACTQILPDADFTQTGVGWNRYGYTKKFKPDVECLLQGVDTAGCALQCLCASQLVKAPPRSGLYYFHAETPSGKFLSFPWVVAPQSPQSRVAVIASTNTWNAYNNFGGRSNYVNANQLPPRPTVNARLDLGRYAGGSVWEFADDEYAPLSFDRPEPFNHIPKETKLTDPIRGRQPCHLAEAEWRLLGWLEREGFDYDLYSDYQLHAGRLDLDSYDVLIISTHPEYWSREQYLRVKRWVFERGGKLMYLGGNGIDCEVELPSEATMRCKTWIPVPPGVPFVDPADGKTYDCRFHHKVESPAELLGVVFTEAGCATSAPYRAVDASHWIFTGTGLKDGDVFGTRSLHERCPGGASGHETDKRTASSPAGAVVLARGMNVNDGGAEVVYHETPSGGAVFSVGSITWPACVLVDEPCSRITRNVLERMLSGSGKRPNATAAPAAAPVAR
jgi:N,N-dimethylformamidase